MWDKLIKFYFKNLSSKEREYFISNYNDFDFINVIKKITNLFMNYPFYHKKIIEETSRIDTLDNVTEWQRAYYLSIYKEFHRSNNSSGRYYNEASNEVTSLYKTLEFKNSSFQFLINFKSSLKGDISKLQKDDLNMLRNLYSYTILKSYEKDTLEDSKITPSSKLSPPQIDEIKKKALETFSEMKRRLKDNF